MRRNFRGFAVLQTEAQARSAGGLDCAAAIGDECMLRAGGLAMLGHEVEA
jgi:hypothetical protein